MALQGSGSISISQINTEKGNTPTAANSSLTTLSTTNINTWSNSKPNGSTPHSMSEFYGYRNDTPAITNLSASADVANNRFAVSWTYTYIGANARQDLQWYIGGSGTTTVIGVTSTHYVTGHGYTLANSGTAATFTVTVYFYNTSTGATVGSASATATFYYDSGGGGDGA